MSETKTEARPLTPAEARALDALVEWRRARATWIASTLNGTARRSGLYGIYVRAEDAVCDAADALVAEREVKRG